ncbi:MAG: hypothetical protein ACUVS2_03130 [Candidatus Flexifilum sp.]|jgi:hypothetical protein
MYRMGGWPGKFHWGWVVGLIVFMMLFSGAFRSILFIAPFLLAGAFFFFILPRILTRAQTWGGCTPRQRNDAGWRARTGPDWIQRYHEEKRKRGFAEAEDTVYAEKPKRSGHHRTDYVIGPDGELEPIRRAGADDYV